MNKQWHYVRDGEKAGPVPAAQLEELAKNGVIGPTDLVWAQGLPEWIEARRVPGLLPASAPPDPLETLVAAPGIQDSPVDHKRSIEPASSAVTSVVVSAAVDNGSHANRVEAEPVELNTVDDFLEYIGLPQYIPLFRNQNIEGDMLAQLSDEDLERIGVLSMGHRKTIIAEIEYLAVQAEEEETALAQQEEDTRNQQSGMACSNFVRSTGFIIGFILGFAGEKGFMQSLLEGVIFGVIGIIVLYIYMLPTIISFKKGHEHRWAIAIGNIFLGTTGIIWVVLLVLAFNFVSPTAATVLGAAALLRKR